MKNIRNEMQAELYNRIIPYWSKLRDKENGGFYGYVNFDGVLNKNAEKGGILNSRLLWFFSAAYCHKKDENVLAMARHAYEFLKDKIIDKGYKGLYWMVDYKGTPADTRKHTYNQAFGIYALAEYYKASHDKNALELAISLFELIEEKCKDELGYLEEFDQGWHEKENEMLSENDVISDKTMNTHLHVLEAYTVLYEVWENERVKNALIFLLDICRNKLYSEKDNSLKVFFDRKWNETVDVKSFGHDIEASWLIDRAAEVLGKKSLIDSTKAYTLKIAENIFNTAYSFRSLDNERAKGKLDTDRIWWVQAEAIVGFINAYEKTKDKKYFTAAQNIWEFIKENIIDNRIGSEWYWKVNKTGEAYRKPIVEPWKCPYHNGRMCIETIERMDKMFKERYNIELRKYNELVTRKNEKQDFYNGIFNRFKYPVLTRNHVPLFWKYDLNRASNPNFMERLGINAAFNSGAIELNGKFYLVVRVEGNDRKSFFAVAESPNGIDNFCFWDYPIELPDTEKDETNVYDMRLTKHEDGFIYGVFCSESKDPSAAIGDLSSAIAKAGIVRTRDLVTWERLPNLQTKSSQQRNVVLHPEFVDGKYAFYTRPQDGFIDAGSGGGICFGLSDNMEAPRIENEILINSRQYHTITETKNGAGCVPIKTYKGWIHIAHGVRNTAAGLRYVIYLFVTDLKNPERVIAAPGGYLISPLGEERIGDVSNVVFTNGAIALDNGEVYIYYASSDTRTHVATTTIEQLLDYAFNTPPDPLRSVDCVKQRNNMIRQNLEILRASKDI
jgi:mannose/cellobiose epimerase-like protein (N-acyl-D-glucosamine 2-epimerase family)/predicted GH43/DUF377 family glycosyl hydrolase